MEALFKIYPKCAKTRSVAVPMKPGSYSIHNGLTIYEACANLTNKFQHPMACFYMSGGAGFNDVQDILFYEHAVNLNKKDILNDEQQNLLIFTKAAILS